MTYWHSNDVLAVLTICLSQFHSVRCNPRSPFLFYSHFLFHSNHLPTTFPHLLTYNRGNLGSILNSGEKNWIDNAFEIKMSTFQRIFIFCNSLLLLKILNLYYNCFILCIFKNINHLFENCFNIDNKSIWKWKLK